MPELAHDPVLVALLELLGWGVAWFALAWVLLYLGELAWKFIKTL